MGKEGWAMTVSQCLQEYTRLGTWLAGSEARFMRGSPKNRPERTKRRGARLTQRTKGMVCVLGNERRGNACVGRQGCVPVLVCARATTVPSRRLESARPVRSDATMSS